MKCSVKGVALGRDTGHQLPVGFVRRRQPSSPYQLRPFRNGAMNVTSQPTPDAAPDDPGQPSDAVRVRQQGSLAVEDGRVVEHSFQLDSLTLLQQLGLVVVPGPRLLPRILTHQLSKLRRDRG